MYYYEIIEDFVLKYKISLDEKELKELRFEIIENCSHIIHKRYRTTKTPNQFDYEHIRNYHEKRVGTIEYNDFYSFPEDEYLVEYDYYEHPPLVALIDSLLKGDTSSIDKIKKSQEEKVDEEEILLKEQQRIIENLNNIEDKKIDKYLSELNDIHEKILKYQKEKQLNKKQISVNNYIEKVLNCIKYEEIGRFSLETILAVRRFLDNSQESTMTSELNKVLKLQRKN